MLLARDAPIGVIFRRGPTKFVRVVMWNRETDKFKLGQWFKGRIFADRSDISPDGRHLIYFAMGGLAWAIPETKGTWTAISQLPLLKATALWGQGDTWSGGGIFISNKAFCLDADASTFLIRDNSGLQRDMRARAAGLYEPRLARAGWAMRTAENNTRIYEKAIRAGWLLRRLESPKSKVRYELEQPGESTLSFPAWEWAERDRQRVVWAERGCLRAARIGSHKLGPVRTLHDFNDIQPPLTRVH